GVFMRSTRRVNICPAASFRLHVTQGGSQTQVLDEGIEIAVAIQQGVVADDAACRNDRVYRLTGGDAACAKGPEVPRSLKSDFRPSERHDVQSCEQPARLLELGVAAKSLQDFGEHEIPGREQI